MPPRDLHKLLRIGVFCHGRIIEERLLWPPRPVTIGNAFGDTDLFVPLAGVPPRRTLFDVRDGRCVLCVSDAMSGCVSSEEGAKFRSLDALRRESGTPERHEAFEVSLSDDARGKIVLGEAVILFHFVDPPSDSRAAPLRLPAVMRRPLRRTIEPALALMIAISAVLQLAPLGYVLSRDWPEHRDTLRTLRDEFASYAKLEYVEPPSLHPTQKTPTRRAGALEHRPSPSSATGRAHHRRVATRHRARKSGTAAKNQPVRVAHPVAKDTILSVLGARGHGGTSRAFHALMATADSKSVDDAFAHSDHIKVATLGSGDDLGARLGASASRTGHAVASGGALGPLGGVAAADRVRIQAKREVRVHFRFKQLPLILPAPGLVDATTVSELIKRREHRIRMCYERKLKVYPNLAGEVVITFTIAPRGARGRVSNATPGVDTVGHGVGQCVANVIAHIVFPKPHHGPVTINKAFIFESGS